MTRYLLSFTLAFLAAAPAAAAVPPVKTMYVEAAAREQDARAALAGPAASPAALKGVRAAVASYEAVVRRYPTSGYCDNALWQAARLALDAFERFGEVRDQEAGTRLLRRLAAEYPTSKLAKGLPSLLAGPEAAQRTSLPGATKTAAAARTPAAKTPKSALLTNIQRSVLPDAVRVTIALDTEVPFHDERIAGPARVFIDFPTTRAAAALVDQTLRFEEDHDPVRQVRIGRQPNATTRVVLDATGTSGYSVYPIYNPYRLVVDMIRTAPAGAPAALVVPGLTTARSSGLAASLAPPPSAVRVSPAAGRPGKPDAAVPVVTALGGRRIITTWARTLPAVTPEATASLAAARLPDVLVSRKRSNDWARTLPNVKPQAAAALSAARAPEPALVSHRRGTTWAALPHVSPSSRAAIADALAPAVPEPPVVAAAIPAPAPLATPIAPPTAPTAPSPNMGAGYSMARQLGLGVSRIVIDPGHGGHDPGAKGKGSLTEAQLVLDVSLRLQKLLEKVPGVEVILTRKSDEFVPLAERTAIANREGADLFLSIHANASANDQARGVETYFLNFANNLSAAAVAARENAASGQAMGALPDFVKAIALNNKLNESHDFAALVQQSMVERLRQTNKAVKNLGVKQAPFAVLIGASMPSVLAEISFLTNEQEGKLLKGNAYRQKIAEALFAAVRNYQGSLKHIQTAQLQ